MGWFISGDDAVGYGEGGAVMDAGTGVQEFSPNIMPIAYLNFESISQCLSVTHPLEKHLGVHVHRMCGVVITPPARGPSDVAARINSASAVVAELKSNHIHATFCRDCRADVGHRRRQKHCSLVK